MIRHPTPFLPNHPFWQFSCQAYPPLEEILLRLQNQYDLNINVLLFCCWYAANNYGMLTKIEVKKLLTAIHTWHKRIVLPIRKIRQKLKSEEPADWRQALYAETLTTELTAEQVEQLLIVDCILNKTPHARKPHAQKPTHACQNILTYCQVLYVHLDPADHTLLGQILTVVFPELHIDAALNLCHSLLLHKQKPKSGLQKQKQLELVIE